MRVAFPPGEMRPVATNADGCNVELSWVAPDDGGSPITKVKVEVRSKGQKFYALDCDAAPCVVPMRKLYQFPYSLRPGDLVVARAHAQNAEGWGKLSPLNTEGATMA